MQKIALLPVPGPRRLPGKRWHQEGVTSCIGRRNRQTVSFFEEQEPCLNAEIRELAWKKESMQNAMNKDYILSIDIVGTKDNVDSFKPD